MTIFFFAIWILLTSSLAQDTPYYNLDVKKNQDIGAINQNFRELTNSAQSNALRVRDSVTGSTTPGITCLAGSSFCVDGNNNVVILGANGVQFSDGTTQTSAATTTASSSTFTGQETFTNTVTFSSAPRITAYGVQTTTSVPNVLYADFFPKAVVNFSGNGGINYSINITSVTRSATGTYAINLAQVFTSSTSMLVNCTSHQSIANNLCTASTNLLSTTQLIILTTNGSTATDCTMVMCTIWGKL